YYADPEAKCQVFHICTADGQGGLAKYSFLCPNGTIFNQNYFICDWWFNFDCSEAEGLYSKNEEIAAEREAASAAAAASASDAVLSYASPAAKPAPAKAAPAKAPAAPKPSTKAAPAAKPASKAAAATSYAP
ncbi:MAG: chitin binding peritrophin-A domain-containing protein, partial [bacterium]